MKQVWLWLTVGFVFFSVGGGFAEESFLPQDLAALPSGVIKYDSYDPDSTPFGRSIKNFSNYWVGVKFVLPSDECICFGFTLTHLAFKIDNSSLNTDDTAYFYVVRHDANSGLPDFQNGVLESLKIVAPLDRLQGVPLISEHSFGNEPFWIVLGPVPGGPDNEQRGEGWWAFTDTTPNENSFYSSNRLIWTQDFMTNPGNFVIRAHGNFSATPQVVVNEVMFNADPSSADPARDHEWVELYNPAEIQTLADWSIIDGYRSTSERDSFKLPSVDMPTGSYLVVHFDTSTTGTDLDLTDGVGHIYTGTTHGVFHDSKDACALLLPELAGSRTYRDVVGWNVENLRLGEEGTAALTPTEQHARFSIELDTVRRVMPVGTVGPLFSSGIGLSVGRNGAGTDDTTGTTQDIAFVGGTTAAGPTLGRSNVLPMIVDNSNVQTPAASNALWTLMFYIAADNGSGIFTQSRWCYDLLNQVERVLPASPENINVVVLFDSWGVSPQVGSPAGPSATYRGVLRRDLSDTVRNLGFISSSFNTGDPDSLAGFITWAKGLFPASNYALVLKGDGAGWQGLCGDASSIDRIEMGELKSALGAGLGTDSLGLLIFDAPFMSQLEVATQVKNFAHFMVASPEMTGPADFDYAHLVSKLNSQPSISRTDLAGFAVDSILDRRLRLDPFSVWTAIRLDGLGPLLAWVDSLARHSEAGVKDACGSDNFSDNYQLRIRSFLRRISTDHYGIQAQGMADFVDLKRLAQSLKELIPSTCTQGQHNKGAIEVENLLIPEGPIITALGGGGTELGGYHYGVGPAGGLSIYFPSARQRDIPIAPKGFRLRPYTSRSDHPFDSAGLETEGGISQGRRIYAADLTACYPHAGDTCSTSDSSDARNHPFQPVADFDFVRDYHWDEFLIRYYKPVADAGPGIPIDRQLNEVFSLDASGTSDPDDSLSTLSYYWDLFAADDPSTSCSDYRLDDLDKDCVNNGNDDADSNSQIISLKYTTSGTHWVWLHVWDPTDNNLDDSRRRFQTSKDSVEIQIQFRGIHLVYEDAVVRPVYTGSFPDVPSTRQLNATSTSTRNGLPEDTFIVYVPSATTGEPHVIWATGSASPPLFPSACQKAINKSLAHEGMGFLIFGPGVAGDPEAKRYFDSLGFAIDPTPTPSANFIVPDSTYPQHFLFELDSLHLSPPGVQLGLDAASLDSCVFPILKTDAGKIVAAAKVTDSGKHAVVYFAFDLGQLGNSSDRIALLAKALGWLASPVPPQNVPVCCVKGDVNQDGTLSAADVIKLVNCSFSQTESCLLCAADVNCSGDLSGGDIVILLQMAFNNANDECP
ncbi:MAG: clostripain-related cysteine peptidase [candidate division Zixibacteria bacterium]|nr:clostripain-related cysteine peptidase [candidate division Zixibacteria bacterium]